MQNLKDGYELLANLLMHEYTCCREFMLARFDSGLAKRKKSSDPDSHQSDPDVDSAETHLNESRRQLRTLQKLKEEEDSSKLEDEDARAPFKDVASMEETGALQVYDALLKDILTRLAAKEVKETWASILFES